MERELGHVDLFLRADLGEQERGELHRLAVVHAESHDLARENIKEQVQVKILPAQRRQQVRDVPRVNLIWLIRFEGLRTMAGFRARPSAVRKLLSRRQDPVKRRLRRHVLASVSQRRHDLARAFVAELAARRRLQDFLPLDDREAVLRGRQRPVAAIAGRLRPLPSLQRPLVHANRLARPVLP